MALDFAVLPPEINSGRMYIGPGAGPMVAAAAAWDGLAAELNAVSMGYRAVLSELTTGNWVGPSSALMTAAAAPYVSWVDTTAAQAEQTSSQLVSAIAAYEAAFAATVPPPEIEINRAMLAALVATNLLGQNTPAIAALEAQYTQMWAQDAAAMYGYAGASAAATTVTPFVAPNPTTNPADAANQATALNQAPAAATTQSQLSQLVSAVPGALQSLASASPSFDPVAWLESLLGSELGTDMNTFAMNVGNWSLVLSGFLFTASGITPLMGGLYALALPATAAAGVSEVAPAAGLGTLADSYTAAGASAPAAAGVSAGLGEAVSVGSLSVPESWVSSPAIRLAATASPLSTAGLAGAAEAGPAGGFFGGVPPVGSWVNAPRGDQARLRSGTHSKMLPPWATEPEAEQPVSKRPAPQRAAQHIASALSERERDELDKLRKEISDVAMERDAAARLIKEAML